MGKFLFELIAIAAPSYIYYNICDRVEVAEEIIGRSVSFDGMITAFDVLFFAMILIIIISFINWIDR